jgi:hypothetical protein
MTIERRFPPNTDPLATFSAGSSADRRAQVQREQQEVAAERQRQLASQASPLTEPEERIRIWERLHSLSLPLLGTHKLVRVIAAQTELTVQQVQQEQQRRLEQTKT